MSNELNLNDLGLGDNAQSAMNEKMPTENFNLNELGLGETLNQL